MNKRLSVLIIEAIENDAMLLVQELEQGGYVVMFDRVDNASDFLSALNNLKWDVIFSDFVMPIFDAPTALKMVREKAIDIPFIVVSGMTGEDTAVAALKAGAHDFMVKGNLARLIPAMKREIGEANERLKRRIVERKLIQSEERFIKVFDASPVAISISSKTRDLFLDVNQQFLNLTGYDRAEVIGYSSVELGLWFDIQDRDAIAQVLVEQGTIRNLEHQFRTKSGELRHVLASFTTIDLSGEPCVLTMCHDISERKQTKLHRRSAKLTSEIGLQTTLCHCGYKILKP